MSKYKILVIGLLVKNNTVKGYGELVTSDELIRPAAELIEEGFITEVSDSATKDKKADGETKTTGDKTSVPPVKKETAAAPKKDKPAKEPKAKEIPAAAPVDPIANLKR